MRIVVNDIAASTGGAMTILKDFYQCVRDNDTENEWIFLLGDHYLEQTDRIKIMTFPQVKNSKLKKLKFDFFEGKKIIAALAPDIVFSLQNIITFGLNVPQVVYIHQPVPFQSVKKFSLMKKAERSTWVYQHMIGSIIKRSAKKADKIIVQTTWIKDAIVKKCKLSDDKISVIPPNINDVSPYICESVFDPTSFFYPTSVSIYKNNECLVAATEALASEGHQFSVTMTLPKGKENEHISYIGKIPYGEVFAHYQRGTMVFPSYIESFGYPLVEARAVGTLILASDCPFSRELLAGYENAYFFDPFSPEELTLLMKRVIEGDILKKEVARESIESHNNWLDVLSEIKSAAEASKD